MASTTVTVELQWQSVDPDGSTCALCDDACYLTQWQLAVVIAGITNQPTDVCLCGSCYDAMESLD